MRTDRLHRVFPISGVLFALVLAGGLTLTSGEPDAGTSRARIFDYWSGHYGRQLVSSLILIPFAIVFLLLFTAELRRVLRSSEADEAIYSPVALAGGVLAAAGFGVTGSLGAAVATAAHHDDANATYTLVQLQSYDWVPWMVGFGVLLLASGVGGLRTRALPKALAIPALVLGVACLTPLGLFALFAIPVWTAAAGIVLYRAQRGAARARVSRVATGVALLLALILLGTAGAASASAPGKNGSITFRRYFDDQQSWGAVFTVRPDGSQVKQITRPPRGVVDDQPSWAPDGSAIAFTRCLPEGLCHIWTVARDGSRLAPVGPLCPLGANEQMCSDDGHADFSSDSKQLVFVQSSGRVTHVPITGQQIEHSAITVMNRDGTGRRIILTTNGFAADLDYPIFSPDGRQIVFERHNSGLSTPADKHAVFAMGLDGSNPHRLTPWAEDDGDNPDWSPDGKWIVFHSHQGENDGRQGQYFLIHPAGTGRRQVTHYPRGTHITSASFSPDGSSIVFGKGPEGGNIDVYTMRLDGTHVRRLTRSKLWDSAPDWGSAAASADRVPASAAAAFPSGTWRVTVTTNDLVSRGVTGSDVPGNRGVWNWTFAGTTWTEQQQEKPGGVITDVHHGRIAVRGARVCFTDTGENFSIGCYAWSRSGSALRFSKPTFRGPLAIGDGPGILKSIFIVHPWLHSTRALASAAATTISFGACAFGSGTVTVPAGPVAVHLPGYADGTYGLLNEVVKAQTTTLTVSGPDGASTRDLSALWSSPTNSGLGFWVIRQPDQSIGVLAPGETVTVTYDVTFRHPTAIVFPPVGPSGFNGPFMITEDGPYTCEVTA